MERPLERPLDRVIHELWAQKQGRVTTMMTEADLTIIRKAVREEVRLEVQALIRTLEEYGSEARAALIENVRLKAQLAELLEGKRT